MRNSTTWESGSIWRTGKTKLIRVPEAIADEVMAYARDLDRGFAVLHGISADDKQAVILSAIAEYIILRGSGRHANQHGKTVDVRSRTWDELRKFAATVEQQPDKLGVRNE